MIPTADAAVRLSLRRRLFHFQPLVLVIVIQCSGGGSKATAKVGFELASKYRGSCSSFFIFSLPSFLPFFGPSKVNEQSSGI